MRIRLFRFVWLLSLGLLPLSAIAQTTVTGTITDIKTGEELIGASVVVKGTVNGTVSSFDGTFTLEVENGDHTLVFSYIGYDAIEKNVSLNGTPVDMGIVTLGSNDVGLDEVKVVANFAVDRKTPVAVSTIQPKMIEEKLGSQEFPQVLKATPGVYATNSGGGFGDSRITLRGFDTDNIAVMINGVPVNDMENGAVYWSNWSGLSDVTRTMQVQRGMGASKLAVPSAGGTINILTATTDSKPGGNIYYGIGNDGYEKMAFTASTGLNDKGWAFTFSGSHTEGKGWADGLQFEGWSYFANVSKVINDKHTLSFNVFGANQSHGQRRTMMSLDEWNQYGRKHNADWGYLNGSEYNARTNYYSKPQMSLNHFWNINDDLNLKTVLYASQGRGGGVAGFGDDRNFNDYRVGDSRSLIDFDRLYRENAQNGQSSTYMASSVNNHDWYGGVSTLDWNVNNNLKFIGGLDGRYYYGEHYQVLDDLMGGQYAVVNRNKYGQNMDVVVREGDIVGYHSDGEVLWESAFAQLEYSEGRLSSFVNMAAANVSYRRYDFEDHAKGDHITDWQHHQTISAKAGVNFNIDGKNNVFFNTGYFQRPPMMNAVFINNTNNVNDGAKNEGIYSVELGYGYRSNTLSVNANAYYTYWQDKTMIQSMYDDNGEFFGYANILGLDAQHMGVEVDFEWRPTTKLTVTGMGSVGDWTWANDVNATFVDQDQNIIGDYKLYTEGLKVGNSAQITAALGAKYEILEGLSIGADYTYFAKNYANFSPEDRTDEASSGVQAWQLPNFGLLDVNASYRFKIGNLNASAFTQISNLLDEWYIADANDGRTWDASSMYIGLGRTWSFGLKLDF
ncbi:TonB-dependent receptor [Saccharicrinis aurantiacus]|uniref:TonB-dependent receptor n=1 Tax=Saccharicrinis aurantiacus TaxID=1849719 RepID=UPI0024909ED8|nr:carboxypeptidase-like regulatory domain-containing protein [Saccharicrinis aurantiacus]